MAQDRLGLHLTTSDETAAIYVDAVDRMLAAWQGVLPRLTRTLELDPEFALGHAAMARYLAMQGDISGARNSADRARELASLVSRREQQHIECIALLVHGDAKKSLQCIEAHVEEFACDSLALSLALGAFGLYAFSGNADHDAVRLAVCERLAPKQPADDWWFLTYLGWGHTEAGHLKLGQQITQRGFDLRHENAHGAHSMAHSFHECGQLQESVAHLDAWLPNYESDGQLYCHLNWHRALVDLQSGNVDAALTRFHEKLSPAISKSPPINILTDSASLFWRIALYTDPAPELPWQLLADYAHEKWPQPAVAFIDIHCAMADAASHTIERANKRSEKMRELDRAGKMPAGDLPSTLMDAISAYATSEYALAADLGDAALEQLPRMGGSHAQREVLEETLIAACLKCGREERAKQLLDKRLAIRPNRVDERWLAMTH